MIEVPSPVVLAGNSQLNAVQADMPRVRALLEREMRWYSGVPRLEDTAAIESAVAVSDLLHVPDDDNIRLIGRFQNPDLHSLYPPYLAPYALLALQRLGHEWRARADILGVPAEARLAVTSLVRSADYQRQLVEGGKLAVPDSTHGTGGTFDIDSSGYFMLDDDGRPLSVSMRDPRHAERISREFREVMGAEQVDVRHIGPDVYDPRVAKALGQAAQYLGGKGIVNYVPEMPGTDNSVAHIAVAPPLFGADTGIAELKVVS